MGRRKAVVAYSFKRRFAPPILAGLVPGPLVPGMKRQTVRADRKRHARPGEELQLYTGMRTASCELLGRADCTSVLPIRLLLGRSPTVEIGGEPAIAGAKGLDLFAQLDGFGDWPDLCAFWAAEHEALTDFSGQLIRWQPSTRRHDDGMSPPSSERRSQRLPGDRA